jgi:hypothetical protein
VLQLIQVVNFLELLNKMGKNDSSSFLNKNYDQPSGVERIPDLLEFETSVGYVDR